MADVREVKVDQDLAVYEPVHETIYIDSDDTDYSEEEDNPDEVSAQFVNEVPDNTNNLHFAESERTAIKEDPELVVSPQPVVYNNSKYFKKQNQASNQSTSSDHQSSNSSTSSNGVKRKHNEIEYNELSASDIKAEMKNEDVKLINSVENLRDTSIKKYNSIRKWVQTGQARCNRFDTKFRLMSFNLLSQHRITRRPAAFRSKQEEHLTWEHRFEAIKREVEMVKPEVVCFQELDFQDDNNINCDIDRYMSSAGYKHHAFKRKSPKVDGCAVFFKDALFESEEVSCVKLYNDDIECLKGSSSVGIIVRLKVRSQSSRLVVGTLHLKFGKDQHLIRLVQTALFLADMNHMCSGPNNFVYPAILAGDFNLEPYTDVHRLIVKGELKYRGLPCGSGKYPDIIFPPEFGVGHDLRWKLDGDADSKIAGRFRHQFGFRSVYQYREERSLYLGYAPPESEVTAYQGTWVSVDHIFYSTLPIHRSDHSFSIEKHLKLLGKWSLPSESQIVKLGGLPSSIAPSDHLPLAAEFLLLDNQRNY